MTPPPPGVTAALDRVVDPCSAAMGLHLGLAELGLVDAVEVDGGTVRVRLVTTSPGCRFGPAMATALGDALREVPGVDAAEVELDPAAVWTEGRMAPAAAAALAAGRAQRAARVSPHDWGRR